MQDARHQRHGNEHGQKNQHVGRDAPPGGIGYGREARGQQGVVVVRGPKTAQKRHQTRHFGHKTLKKTPPGKDHQGEHHQKIKYVLPHAFVLRGPRWSGAAGTRPGATPCAVAWSIADARTGHNARTGPPCPAALPLGVALRRYAVALC